MDIKDLSREEAYQLYEACKNDIELFAQIFFPHILTNKIPAYQKILYKALKKRYRYFGAVLFRGAGKSTISKVIKGAWDIVYTREPVEVWISESIDQSAKHLEALKDEVFYNERLQTFFGDLKGSKNNIEEVEFANGVYITVKGYGSRIRGISWKNQRPTRILLDDFESESNTRTELQRTDVFNWINRQIMPAGDVNTTIEFWGTIVHKKSYLNTIKDLGLFKPPQGFYINVPIESDGKLAWADRYDWNWIKQKREYYEKLGDLKSFFQEYYNIYASNDRELFDPDKIQIINGSFETYEMLTYINTSTKKIPVNTFIGVDTSTGLSNDYTSIIVIGALPDNTFVILDVVNEKLLPTEQLNTLGELINLYKPKMVTIETQNYEIALVDFLRQKIREKVIKPTSVMPFRSKKDKSGKYKEYLEPYINNGVIFALPMSGYDALIKQMKEYNEGNNSNDDILDALLLAIHNAYPVKKYNVEDKIKQLQMRKFDHERRYTDWYVA